MGQYAQIEKLIGKIVSTSNTLDLKGLAQFSKTSLGHIQKMFVNWAGISPKQFNRYLTLNNAKEILAKGTTHISTASKIGLSSTGRLHDLFVDIEAMTPDEYQHGGKNLTIFYSIFESKFGPCLVGSTQKGIVNILFNNSSKELLTELKSRWPHARIVKKSQPLHLPVKKYLTKLNSKTRIKVHLHGTNFQIKVWEALLTLPRGVTVNYQYLAEKMGNKKASRAVGSAIGKNPVGYIIPCHRVLKSTGEIGGYHWGQERKRAMLVHEALQNEKATPDRTK